MTPAIAELVERLNDPLKAGLLLSPNTRAFIRSAATALVAQSERIAELEGALHRAKKWMNVRVGNSWEAHDAVDPTLWDEIETALSRCKGGDV